VSEPSPPSIVPETSAPSENAKLSLLEPPVRFSTAEKANPPTLPELATLIVQVLAALAPVSASPALLLPTSLSIPLKPPVEVAAPVWRFTAIGPPPLAV